jgi:hypothetical protein
MSPLLFSVGEFRQVGNYKALRKTGLIRLKGKREKTVVNLKIKKNDSEFDHLRNHPLTLLQYYLKAD